MDPSKLSLTLRRRDFLRQAGGGIGMIALANLLAEEGRTADTPSLANPFALKPPHFPAKAKNVIFLFMEGAPSQIDLFDPKPELQYPDQIPNLLRHAGPTWLAAADFPRPEQAKALTMPGDNGFFLEYFSLIKKGEAMKEEQPQQRLKGPADYRGARRTCAL